jgi:NADH dehydrogenase
VTACPHIIVVGFAGVACARTLRQRLGSSADITLFNRESYMVFHPLLAEVAGASINSDAVAAALRQMLPGVTVRTEDVVGVDLRGRQLRYQAYDGRLRGLRYDHLVLACGETNNLASVPGMAAHALPLKTLGDALAIRARVMEQLERADVCDDPDRKRWHLTFVVIGGGFSGVEVAGEINELARGACGVYRHIRPDEIRVELVHSRDQLLPEIAPRLRARARQRMEAAGITVILSSRAAYVTAMGVYLSDERRLPAATVVCTVGTTAVPLVEHLDTEKRRGRIVTRPDMRLPEVDGAWAIGDCAWTKNAYDGAPSPPTGQFADRQGRQAAENIVRVLRGQAPQPFTHKPVGELCAIGGRSAVGELFGWRVSGFLAWVLWRSVYLLKLPTLRLRVKVGFDWLWELFFARDLAHIKVAPSSRVSIAHYDAGDDIFRIGDAATDFYIINSGEVEVRGEDAHEPLAVLGQGEFFGEMALLDERPHQHGVRARTRVELVVTPRDVLTRLSALWRRSPRCCARACAGAPSRCGRACRWRSRRCAASRWPASSSPCRRRRCGPATPSSPPSSASTAPARTSAAWSTTRSAWSASSRAPTC